MPTSPFTFSHTNTGPLPLSDSPAAASHSPRVPHSNKRAMPAPRASAAKFVRPAFGTDCPPVTSYSPLSMSRMYSGTANCAAVTRQPRFINSPPSPVRTTTPRPGCDRHKPRPTGTPCPMLDGR